MLLKSTSWNLAMCPYSSLPVELVWHQDGSVAQLHNRTFKSRILFSFGRHLWLEYCSDLHLSLSSCAAFSQFFVWRACHQGSWPLAATNTSHTKWMWQPSRPGVPLAPQPPAAGRQPLEAPTCPRLADARLGACPCLRG